MNHNDAVTLVRRHLGVEPYLIATNNSLGVELWGFPLHRRGDNADDGSRMWDGEHTPPWHEEEMMTGCRGDLGVWIREGNGRADHFDKTYRHVANDPSTYVGESSGDHWDDLYHLIFNSPLRGGPSFHGATLEMILQEELATEEAARIGSISLYVSVRPNRLDLGRREVIVRLWPTHDEDDCCQLTLSSEDEVTCAREMPVEILVCDWLADRFPEVAEFLTRHAGELAAG